tara:strand:+ start:422 stop:568 length:147 start_codon:yes stop_codon:yes gene_type:complete
MKQSTDLKIKEIKKRVSSFMGIQIMSKRKLSDREKKLCQAYGGKNQKN